MSSVANAKMPCGSHCAGKNLSLGRIRVRGVSGSVLDFDFEFVRVVHGSVLDV